MKERKKRKKVIKTGEKISLSSVFTLHYSFFIISKAYTEVEMA